MSLHRLFAFLILFFTAPALCIPQQEAFFQVTDNQSQFPFGPLSQGVLMDGDYLVSYDDILDLIEELEEGDLEDRCSPEELDRIKKFISKLAKNGILPNETGEYQKLEDDIEDLFNPWKMEHGHYFSMNRESDYLFVPGIAYGQGEMLLCKSWFKKKVSRVKKFVKKHKKAILIGAAIVVAATVVLCAVSVATATAAGAAGAASISNSDREENKQVGRNRENAVLTPEMIFEEQTSSLKELIVEDNLLPSTLPIGVRSEANFLEKTRYLGSFLAHETLEGISQITSVIPGFLQEVVDVGRSVRPGFLEEPANSPWANSRDIADDFKNMLQSVHQKIDQLFSTKLTDCYLVERHGPGPLIGNPVTATLPPPGILNPGIGSGQVGRIPMTLANSTWGWKVGDPITNRTLFGTVPKWSTVRRRYWKNQAELIKANRLDSKYSDAIKCSAENIKRMEQGLAPQKLNPKTRQLERMELHHSPPQRDGGLFDFVEVWPEEHANLDPMRCMGN